MKATRFLVSGIVQGVGYRFFTARAARSLGIHGYVRNLPDGRVEVVAAGTEDALREFQEVLRRGPAGALVDNAAASESALDNEMDGFEIRH
ncbi:MAG TPA: acylphosphatase [Candidatus Dormibacteraeota bacterium]|nr:acylphosphatase [Candidatus Dormibacteraeota bacterium]